MRFDPVLDRVLAYIRTAGTASGLAGGAQIVLAGAGLTLGAPVVAVGVAGILAIAGVGAWIEHRAAKATDAKSEAHSAAIASVEQWIMSFATHEACRERGLAAAIAEHLKRHPDKIEGLPEEITRDHLTTFLSIIQSEGEEQTTLLKSHDGFVRAVSDATLERLTGIQAELTKFGAQAKLTYAEIAAMRNAVRETRADTRELIRLWEQQYSPPLFIPRDDSKDERSRFVFRAQKLAFVGRRAEIAELDAWLGDSRSFSWDLWTGHAGMGKSRLALELCLKHAGAWEVGFFDHNTERSIDWTIWAPSCDTLIVFDYVSRWADDIRRALHGLKTYPGTRKIRVLLLERPIARFERPRGEEGDRPSLSLTQAAAEGWWTTVREDADADFRRTHARALAHDRPDRELRGVGADALRGMIAEEATDAEASLDEAELTRRQGLIEAITPDRRPLYIAMAAEAIREKKHVPDARTLIEHILDRESNKHWRPALQRVEPGRGTAEAYRRLVCVATLCGGLTGDALTACLNDARFDDGGGPRLLPSSAQYGDGAVYARLIPDADGADAPKLEPDLLGECFVLTYLEMQPALARKVVEIVLEHAEGGLGDFLRRAGMNFPEHPGVARLIGALPSDLADAAQADILIARAGRLIASGPSRAVWELAKAALESAAPGPAVIATALFAALSAFPTTEPLAPLLARASDIKHGRTASLARQHIAVGLVNAIGHSAANYERADELLDALRALAADDEADEFVWAMLANGLFNAFNNSPARSQRADELLDQLWDISEDRLQQISVRQTLAEGLFNAFHGSDPNSKRADDFLDRLREVARRSPPDAISRAQLASALFKSFYDSPWGSDRARERIGELHSLAEANSENADIRLQFSKLLFNAADRCKPGSAEAIGFLREFRKLAFGNKSDAAVRKHYAAALVQALGKGGNDTLTVNEYIQDLRDYSREESGTPDAVTMLAEGISNGFFHCVPDEPEAEQMMDELESLLSHAPASGHGAARELTEWVTSADPTYRGWWLLTLYLAMLARAIDAAEFGPGREALDAAAAELWAAYKNKYPHGP